MFTYIFDNPKQYNELLQFFALFLLFVIGLMVYFISQKTGELNNQISQLEMECPACPSVPACPACPEGKACPQCPTCPSLTCDNDGRCPDCICPTDQKCPDCPPCNANANCPTVDDIVGGIFPGRNPGITQNGKYFDVQASESYELMPDYNFYEPQEAFPTDSILSPMNSKNTMEIDSVNINTNTMNSKTLSDMPQLGNPQLKPQESPSGSIDSDSMDNESMDSSINQRMARGLPGVPGNGNNNMIGSNGVPSSTRSLSPQ